MVDDPEAWRKPWAYEEWHHEWCARQKQLAIEAKEAKENRRKAREAWKEAKRIEATVHRMQVERVEGDHNRRNWAIWRKRAIEGTSYKQLGLDFGITTERVRQIAKRYDRKMRYALNPKGEQRWNIVSEDIREAALGVEFVFRNEMALDEDARGWERLEFPEEGSVYFPPTPAWRTEWGEQDTKPAKPQPVFTHYKTIIQGAN